MTGKAPAKPRRVNPGTSATLLGAVLTEVDAHETRLQAVEHALAPAFTPMRGTMADEPLRVDPEKWANDPEHIVHKAYTGPEPLALQLRRLGVGHQAPVTGRQGPGEYRQEPTVLAQASTNSNLWASDYEHSAQFLAEAARPGGNIAELRRRSAEDAIMRGEAAARAQVTSDVTPVFCSKTEGPFQCRPATPCSECAGKVRTVVYGADTEAPVQTSVVLSPWDHHEPAMAQQAGRDAILNSVEYHHAASVAGQVNADRQANASALAEQSEALRVRRDAERMQQRSPGESGQIVKGL